jgi:hypothetical protein
MTRPRRHVIRPASIAADNDHRRQRLLERGELRLAKEHAACRRWVTRLKRALRTVDKQLRRIARLEKVVAVLRRT